MKLNTINTTINLNRIGLNRAGSVDVVVNKYEYVPARILSLEGDVLMSSEGDYVLCLVKQKIEKK